MNMEIKKEKIDGLLNLSDEQRKIAQLERMVSMWMDWANRELVQIGPDRELAYLIGMSRSIEPLGKSF